jgi:cyanophycinase
MYESSVAEVVRLAACCPSVRSMSATDTPSTLSPSSRGEATGLLALVGGDEWSDGCTFDAELLEASSADEVLVLPTAAAYEHPERAVERAVAWFSRLGARARGLMVVDRRGAMDPAMASEVRASRFVYIGGGSPLHLRSVLKGSELWSALLDAWHAGAVVAGSSAGAMVLTDPMVDPRGGALTVGLGMVTNLAVIPHFGHENAEKVHRSVALAAPGLAVVGIPERTALVREADGCWRTAGEGEVRVFVSGRPAGFDALAGALVPGGLGTGAPGSSGLGTGAPGSSGLGTGTRGPSGA